MYGVSRKSLAALDVAKILTAGPHGVFKQAFRFVWGLTGPVLLFKLFRMITSVGFYARVLLMLACLAQGLPSVCAATNEPATEIVTNRTDAVATRRLSPNDVVEMKVYLEEELKAKVTVDEKGAVILPLLGEVIIGGMTLETATAHIQKLYGQDYLVNPRINLSVEQFAKRRFAVLGQVQRPSTYEFPENDRLNLFQAIAMAGGYTRLASPAKVSVRRMENGAPRIYELNAGAMVKQQTGKPFEIFPGDIILVGERNF